MDTKDNLTDVVEIADGSEATPSEAPTSEQEVATDSGDIVTLGN